MDNGDKLVTVTEAAAILGVHRNTVRAIIKREEVEVYTATRAHKIPLKWVLEYKENAWRQL